MENIKISKVCGLCAGCKRAIDKTSEHLQNGESVTLFKEIVHNKNVNEFLKNKGVIFEDSLENLNNKSTIIIRAHGEPKSTFAHLESIGAKIEDCTCPNVAKIHQLVEEHSLKNYKIIIIGKYGKTTGKIHPEITGTIGWCNTEPILIEDDEDVDKIKNCDAQKFYLICQTTFNECKANKLIEQIKNILKNKELIVNKSICYAQMQINKHSEELANESDIMVVVGGKNSSNSIELWNNLKKIKTSIFIENINTWKDELEKENITLSKNTKIGLTAGASTMRSELETLKSLIENYILENL